MRIFYLCILSILVSSPVVLLADDIALKNEYYAKYYSDPFELYGFNYRPNWKDFSDYFDLCIDFTRGGWAQGIWFRDYEYIYGLLRPPQLSYSFPENHPYLSMDRMIFKDVNGCVIRVTYWNPYTYSYESDLMSDLYGELKPVKEVSLLLDILAIGTLAFYLFAFAAGLIAGNRSIY